MRKFAGIRRGIVSVACGIAFAVGLFLLSSIPTGMRDIGVIENIHGIPYPTQDGAVVVTEKLAHADIYLREPVIFKKLVLTIEFEPIRVSALHVGVRKDSFWLSYQPVSLLDEGQKPKGTITKTIELPLHDKLQETDRSLDIMFFAEADGEPLWKLQNITAHTKYSWPSFVELKDYVRSVVKRERAL